MTLPVGKGIAGNVAATREPIIVNDVRSDPRFSAQFDKESGYITRQLMAVPMVARGEIVGVAEVLNRKDNKPFTEVDIKILSNLASLAAAIILNTRIIQDQKNFFSHVLELLSSAIETSKSDMDMHPSHCAYLCCAVAKRMGVGDPDYRFLYYAGLLHDIGYIGMKNKRIMSELALLPTAPPDELHVAVSVRMLEGINIFQGALPIIRHHHENFDGTGFPDKLSGQDIPRGARILRLVEAMEEIRMTGGIRGEELKQNAMREAKDGSGTRFDPAVVDAFINLISEEEKIWEF
ncbi:MAG: GAF domain-containing protein [Elusimicrobia bacterium]|nr:GAF domain-containing protein [Elusimicrobiota bacterium]